MISVTEAIESVVKATQKLGPTSVQLEDSLGLILAEDVVSPIDIPSFRQSAMDGYALTHSENRTFKVMDEVPAGSPLNPSPNLDECVRIFTGSRVPDHTDTVVIQEHTERQEGTIQVTKMPESGSNIRAVGEQLKKGDVALEKGTQLNESGIGLLANLGLTDVQCYPQPKIALIVTGNELVPPGTPLQDGQVYESNSITLQLALKRAGINDVGIHRVGDTLKDTIAVIDSVLKEVNILLISGGISVGDHDHVKAALEHNDVQQQFYKVNQKPGKPLWFGSKGSQLVFALPGNPASSLTCLYVYVIPAIRKMMGHSALHLEGGHAISASDIKNHSGKTIFLKAKVEDGQARVLGAQASSMLTSFALSNALIIVPNDQQEIKKGEMVEFVNLDRLSA